ncbi:CBS domain-containing protein [Actinoplanes sp. NPDC026623]|uniref:CBS domain-containing protein n=1 Tax=Actinoplanes sp. NPDC026623 TaxID=3155610 RepID=UPI0033F34163
MRCFVRDVMSTALLCLPDGTPVTEAADVMRRTGVRSTVVIGPGRPAGILTYPEALRRVSAADGHPPTLREIVPDGSMAVHPDDLILTAFEMMRSHGLDRLPVCRGGVPVGIVTLHQVKLSSAVRVVSPWRIHLRRRVPGRDVDHRVTDARVR